ncbi:MAG: BrnA antitoxin family protein [Magnetococcales bacterium]|nr:BrnA antitoxin family protein [Magnetococcales bacterium]
MNDPLINAEGDVRELDLEDFKKMRPIREIHPDMPKRVQGPQQEPIKIPVPLHLDQDVVALFKLQQ